MSEKNTFQMVVKDLGGPVAVAKILNCKHYQSVQQMRRFRIEHCPIIERASNGKYAREMLRPDIDWDDLRGDK